MVDVPEPSHQPQAQKFVQEKAVPGVIRIIDANGDRLMKIVAAILGGLFILTFIFLIISGVKKRGLNIQLDNAQTQVAALETELQTLQEKFEAEAIPLLVATDSGAQYTLYRIDRETGEWEGLYDYDQGAMSVFAVPQFGYDGRVILSLQTEDDDLNPGLHIYTVDSGEDPEEIPFAGELPNSLDAMILAHDQRRIAALYDNPFDKHQQKQMIVWDLLNGKGQVFGAIRSDEYFASNYGEDVFGGASGFSAAWINEECVTASIYKDDDPVEEVDDDGQVISSTVPSEKVFVEDRTFCIH